VIAMSQKATSAMPANPSSPPLLHRFMRPDRLQANAVKLVTGLVLLWGWATIDNFLSTANVNAILYSVAAVGIAAVGMAFITLSGNLFMLSMGATAAVSTIIFASTLHLGLPATLALVVIFGAIVGLLQGVVVGWAASPSSARGMRPGSVSEASPASFRTRSCCSSSSRSSPRSSSSGPASVASCV
jgi:hypothetical protein